MLLKRRKGDRLLQKVCQDPCSALVKLQATVLVIYHNAPSLIILQRLRSCWGPSRASSNHSPPACNPRNPGRLLSALVKESRTFWLALALLLRCHRTLNSLCGIRRLLLLS